MNAKNPFFISVVLWAAVFHPSFLCAQGSLTPPGAPAPTMASLTQIYSKLEARTAVTNTTTLMTISQPGSYYLTTNLTVTNGDAIDITTNQVTLDLNGFTISSTAPSASGFGIYLAVSNGNTDITILNGHIAGGVTNSSSGLFGGAGFDSGIHYSTTQPSNVRVAGVSVSGCLSYGIFLGSDSVTVDSCTIKTAGSIGIVAGNVSHCNASGCGFYGIYATTASDCRGVSVGSGTGLYATTANNCYGQSVSGYGLSATVANNCNGQSGSGTGLSASGSAIGCIGASQSGFGISANIANSCTVSATLANITYKYNMP